MEEFLGLFNYGFVNNALLAALFSSITCGIIGTYIVAKRIVFISGGITHSSFGGIGIGYYFGFNPILGAAIFAILSALGIEYVSRKSDIREDSMIATLWSLGMAVGIIFIFLSPGYAPNLMSYLFGNILTVNTANLIAMFLVCLLAALFFGLFYHTILMVAYDEEFARSQQLPVNLIKQIVVSLIALTIVINIKVIGIILVMSLLTIPQNTVNQFTKQFDKIVYGSILIGFVGAFAGLSAAYLLDIPSGAAIIFVLIIFFFVARMLRAMLERRQIKQKTLQISPKDEV